MYKIRNGKSFAKEAHVMNKLKYKTILYKVLDSISKDIEPNVKGKKIYIPEHIRFALPATEKQFTGNLPSGTCVEIDKDMIAGIHWEDVKSKTIDLDLSLINQDGTKYGWDSSYRADDRGILFSGDITAAPKPRGATELFYVKKKNMQSYIMFVNYFNYCSETPVPFKIVVAKKHLKSLESNYMIDPNNVLSIAQTQIDKKQMILGLLVVTTDKCRFYFSESAMGKGITSSGNDYVQHARNYLFNYYKDSINFNKILEKAGALVVQEKKDIDIDLSPENLEKDTIINILTKFDVKTKNHVPKRIGD